MKTFLRNLALVCATLFAYQIANAQTVSVTADLKNMFGASQATKTQVCFSLVDGNGNQISNPRVLGTGVIVPTATQCVTPDGSGHVSTTVYANDQISPSNSIYSITYLFNGRSVHGDIYQFLLADGTENLNTKTGLTTSPVIPAPTGDTTYARLDGGNQPFTNPIQAPGISSTSDFIVTSLGAVKWGLSGLSTPDLGLSRIAANTLGCGNGTQGDFTCTLRLKILQIGGSDTGLSRGAAGETDFGNGSQGDKSGTGVATIFNALTGFQINGLGTTNRFLKGNGSNFVISNGPASGTGSPTSCTNQFVTGFTLNSDAPPTSNCATVTSGAVDNSIRTTANSVGIIERQCVGTFGAATTNVLVNGSVCNNGIGNQSAVTAGTFKNLLCHSNTGGVNASSGVVTVRKNAVNTAVTCTFGTGVTCGGGDTTHSFTTVTNDLLDILVTTQAAETLATMSCTLEKF